MARIPTTPTATTLAAILAPAAALTITPAPALAQCEPVVVASVDGPAGRMALEGDRLYLSRGDAGLAILDVADPANPVVLGELATPSGVRDLDVRDGLVAIADGSGLLLVDATDPADPAILAHLETPDNAIGVAITGDLAVVGDDVGSVQSRLRVASIADPRAPVLLGSAFTGDFYDVAVDGDLAYVVGLGLRIIDLGVPAEPVVLGSVDPPNADLGVAVSGSLAFVACRGSGLSVVDASDPTAPRILATRGVAGQNDSFRKVAVDGDRVYAANGLNGVEVADVGEPSAPAFIGSVATPEANAIEAGGGYVYVGTAGGLRIIDAGSCRACPADLDGDGALTIFDFLEFQNLFDAGSPRADFDGDGELTIFDFLAFQNAFDAGCP